MRYNSFKLQNGLKLTSEALRLLTQFTLTLKNVIPVDTCVGY